MRRWEGNGGFFVEKDWEGVERLRGKWRSIDRDFMEKKRRKR